MHNTKEIENKNDGIEEKIFTNCKKDRMEKKVQKNPHTHKSWRLGPMGFWVLIIATSSPGVLKLFSIEFPIWKISGKIYAHFISSRVTKKENDQLTETGF